MGADEPGGAELDRLAEGRKRFRGVLQGIEGDQVGIDLEGEAETAMIPIAWILEAKLVLDVTGGAGYKVTVETIEFIG